ncbi:stressosome-associated protein Prli42 [Ornithinibacillus californiensis]|nr:stressosome-associated protein Prli42 [Ornithinibacillus californiensis]
MSAKQTTKPAPKRKSKRDRRMKIAIYIMIFAMVVSTITYGLALFVGF